MIKVWYKDGRYAPIMICDICSRRIEDAKLAVAVHPSGEPGSDKVSEVVHAHKGKCHSAAEEMLGGKVNTGWGELSVHLFNLVHGVKLSPEALSILGKEREALCL